MADEEPDEENGFTGQGGFLEPGCHEVTEASEIVLTAQQRTNIRTVG